MGECELRRDRHKRGYDVARVQHFGPFIGLNLGARASHAWALGPFPKLFESTADVSAHPWPEPGPPYEPGHPLAGPAEIAVTSMHSQITPTAERFLVVTVQNVGALQIEGYNIRVTLTSGGARGEGGS
jgi:hypothetical protein